MHTRKGIQTVEGEVAHEVDDDCGHPVNQFSCCVQLRNSMQNVLLNLRDF